MSLHCRMKFLLIMGLLQFAHLLPGQYYILGRVLDDNEVPYAFATAELRGTDYSSQQVCTELGVFRFENLKSGAYELVLITGYGIRRKKIDLKGSIDITLHVPRNIKMDEISVVANKAGDKEPVSHTNITATELAKRDFAQDIPYILANTPSAVVTSDAGHGIGYTGLRLRGTDPTRINVTLNGIPVNDAESHAVFWVDLPDLASSVTNIQIQRGLGWSQPGVGDFGGGIQINTMGFNAEPYGNLKLSAGSFQTQRATLSGGSGLLNGRFTLDGRASYIHSEGYIDRADNTLYSFYGSAGYHHDQTNLRIVGMMGDELTYQAWNGVPEQYIDDPNLRTYNSAGTEKPGEPHDNEVDDYRQSHVQLHFDQALTPFARFTTALHYTKGKGFFEQYKADQTLADYGISGIDEPSDLTRRLWLDNDFYGFNSTIHIGTPGKRYFIIGSGWNKYEGDHFGEVTWIESNPSLTDIPYYYFNTGIKRDYNLFARSNARITERLDITIDLQNRWIKYQFEGPDANGVLTDQEVNHNFFNPKFGFNFSFSDKSSVYGLTGINHKEPNRDDYIHSTAASRPKAEKMWDTEIGYRLNKEKFNLEIAGFAMMYKDHLVPTGKLNDVGEYTRVNVDESQRIGIEAFTSLRLTDKLTVSAQATWSNNTIESFDEYIDNWDTGIQEVVKHTNTDIAFSPSLLASLQGEYTLVSNEAHEISVNLAGRYVGKQFVDNTSREASALEAYFLADAGARWIWHARPKNDVTLGVSVNNILDQEYESNGWIYRFRSEGYNPVPDDPYAGTEGGSLYHQKGYFPQAGTYILFQLGVSF